MIARLRRLNPEQRRLVLSLVANFATRLPGLVGVLIFLPRLKAVIGLDAFVVLMASIALGGSVTFVMGGVSYVARRLVGDAYSRSDRSGEADAVRTVFDVSMVGIVLCSLVIAGYGALRGSPAVFYAGALITALSAFTIQQDVVRAAYNEHYVTATIQVVVQSLAYVVALLILPASTYGVMLGIAVMIGPLIVASLTSLVGLVRKRPYLLHGRPRHRRAVVRQSIMLGAGDGLITACLNFVTVYLDFEHATAESAWFATTLRLFMVVLVPVILILLPVSSYVRLIWNDCGRARQQRIVMGTLFISIAYSIMVGIAMVLLSRMYVGGMMHIPEPGSMAQTVTIFAMFASVVVFKSYTSVAFVVLDSKALTMSAVIGTVGSIAVAALSVPWLSPIAAVTLLAASLTLTIVMVTTLDALRFCRGSGGGDTRPPLRRDAVDMSQMDHRAANERVDVP